jgi:hypothetical protein
MPGAKSVLWGAGILVRWLGYCQWEHFNSESGLGSDLIYKVFPAPDETFWAGTDTGLLTPGCQSFTQIETNGLVVVHHNYRLVGVRQHITLSAEYAPYVVTVGHRSLSESRPQGVFFFSRP